MEDARLLRYVEEQIAYYDAQLDRAIELLNSLRAHDGRPPITRAQIDRICEARAGKHGLS